MMQRKIFAKLDSLLSLSLFFGGFLFFISKGGDCLQINDLVVPNIVENGSQSAVVLDCDYSINSSETGLVVKWFLNDGDTPVYQWIPPQRPQDLGKLKGKLNLNYKASDEAKKMYRALQILNPSPELSGEYKCTVSTFQKEESQSKKMVIFVPQSNLRFWHTIDADNREDNSVETNFSKDENLVNVTCLAEGVYPEPIIRIFSASKPVSDKTHMKLNMRNGLYDVAASIQVDDDDMDSDEHVFECELSIPEANYTVKQALYVSLENMGTIWLSSVWMLVITTFLSIANSGIL